MRGSYLLELFLVGPLVGMRSRGLVGRRAGAPGPWTALLDCLLLCSSFLLILILFSILFFLSPNLPQSPFRGLQNPGARQGRPWWWWAGRDQWPHPLGQSGCLLPLQGLHYSFQAQSPRWWGCWHQAGPRGKGRLLGRELWVLGPATPTTLNTRGGGHGFREVQGGHKEKGRKIAFPEIDRKVEKARETEPERQKWVLTEDR